MGDTGPVASAIPAKAALAQGWRWINDAWQTLGQQRPLWLGMSGIYLVAAALLEAVPFVGHLVVVLFSPMLLAGALLALREPPAGDVRAANAASSPNALEHARTAVRQLLGAFATESRIYAAVLMGIVVLGVVVIVAIGHYFIGAGSISGGWSAARHGTTSPALLLARMLAATVLDVLLLMGLLYAVHRSVFAWREPMSAISDSFRACLRHPLPIAVFVGAFVLPYIAIAGAFRASFWLGYVVLFTLGAVLLPLFVLASYNSYRDLFPAAPRA